MAMEIRNNYDNFLNNYNQNSVANENKSENKAVATNEISKDVAANKTSDYYSKLQRNYDCMSNGNVSVSNKYLRQCAGDSSKAKELENFLKQIPELEKQGYEQLSAQNAALGGKVTYYQQSWIINDDGSVQSTVYSVTETEMTNAERMKKNMDERLEKQKAKKAEEEKMKERKEEKDKLQEKIKGDGKDSLKAKDISEIPVKYVEAESEEEALALMQKDKEKINGAYYPKVDIGL